MIKDQEVFKWINDNKNVKLLPTQERFISALIGGCDISCPRAFGRTSLVKWYTEYLNEVYANKTFSYESECFITGNEFIQEHPQYEQHLNDAKLRLPKEQFEKEYVCDYR